MPPTSLAKRDCQVQLVSSDDDFLFSLAIESRDFELFFENFTCSRLPNSNSVASNYLQTLNCGLSKNAKRRTVQMELSFKRDLSDFELNVLIVLPRRRAADFVLLNISYINGCDFLANRHLVTLLQIGRKTIDKYGNFPQRCPFQSNTGYYIRGYRWGMDTLPAFAVQTTVHIHFEYLVNGHIIVEGHIKSRLDLKSGRKEAATGWFAVD
ncbi:uncharacterized protein LOC110118674 [Ceratitis capitata]|uniref:uncharacterized protein LOC110118674 n=1 Tax=Ceratitis capitata TaxID=7213 RepID=UPI000A11035D|nr:uncharacterized protein LOC110118674 [Ceratitis capitata]